MGKELFIDFNCPNCEQIFKIPVSNYSRSKIYTYPHCDYSFTVGGDIRKNIQKLIEAVETELEKHNNGEISLSRQELNARRSILQMFKAFL